MKKSTPSGMQKIVVDTNVIVSALIGSGFPRKILYDLVFEKEVILCLSNEVFEEYIEVLNREKFRKYPHFVTQAEIVLSRLLELSEKYVPEIRVSKISDESDNRIGRCRKGGFHYHRQHPRFLIP